jgi:hypothetical protein
VGWGLGLLLLRDEVTLWGWDADGLGSAGFDGTAGDGLGGFV